MANGTDDIIIKGGSVELKFDDTVYVKDHSDGKFKHRDRKVIRVLITDESGAIHFDSGDHPAGLRWTVSVVCK
jgi:hypothetical protein